jgi:hypothetical protein
MVLKVETVDDDDAGKTSRSVESETKDCGL